MKEYSVDAENWLQNLLFSRVFLHIMSKTRNSYHTNFKLAVQLGLVEQERLKALPRSSIHRFTKTDYSSLVGAESQGYDERLELARVVLRSKKAAALVSAYSRIASFLRSANLSLSRLSKIKNMDLRSRLVDRIKNAAQYLPFGQILSALKLTYARFKAWERGRIPCTSSPLGKCRAAHPSQLIISEIKDIKKAFFDPATFHWPASSIAWKLIHSGTVSANLVTIMKYAKILNLTHARSVRKKPVKRGSITATHPNEAWHIDATFIRTMDGARAVIQFIMDSFSRKILAFRIMQSVSAASTVSLLKEAEAVSGIQPSEQVLLISDGGPENDNELVTTYVASSPLKHLIAQTDVHFSNSIIEAANKILKYRYIFKKNYQSFSGLRTGVPDDISDYNERPHCKLEGLSPNQAFDGIIFDKVAYRERLAASRGQRLLMNRASCPPCVPLALEDHYPSVQEVIG